MVSVQFKCLVVSDSLWPYGLQNTRPPCPSPTPGAYSVSSIESGMPSNHLILCRPLLLLPSAFPSIRVFFPVSQFFTAGGQSIGASASASVLPMNIQDWFPLGLTGSISFQSQGLSQFESTNSLALSFLYGPILTYIHDYWKNHSLTIRTFVSKVISLLFNMLSGLS